MNIEYEQVYVVELRIIKFFVVVVVFYIGFFQQVFSQIPHILQVFGIIIVVFLIMDITKHSTPLNWFLTEEIFLWISFAITSLAIGMIIVNNQMRLVSAIFTLMQHLVLIISLIYISKIDNNVAFINKLIISLMLVATVFTIFRGEGYLGSARVSLTRNTNPNNLGILLVVGLNVLLSSLNLSLIRNNIFLIVVALAVFYVATIGGSRATFLALLLTISYWAVFCYPREKAKSTHVAKRMVSLALFAIMLVLGFKFFKEIYANSIVAERLNVLVDSGTGSRGAMYREAFEFFLKRPFFGVGYKNYENISKFNTYSHSTYAEVLACTGLLGTILYLGAYFIIMHKYLHLIKNTLGRSKIKRETKMLFGLFLSLLFLGIAVIHYYEIYSNLAFALLISYSNTHKQRRVSNQNDIS